MECRQFKGLGFPKVAGIAQIRSGTRVVLYGEPATPAKSMMPVVRPQLLHRSNKWIAWQKMEKMDGNGEKWREMVALTGS
jgi:hypothetical protein